MKTIARATMMTAALGLMLSGCAAGMGQQALTNLQGCERRYDGVISAGLGAGFSGSVTIHCPARPVEVAPADDEIE